MLQLFHIDAKTLQNLYSLTSSYKLQRHLKDIRAINRSKSKFGILKCVYKFVNYFINYKWLVNP